MNVTVAINYPNFGWSGDMILGFGDFDPIDINSIKKNEVKLSTFSIILTGMI